MADKTNIKIRAIVTGATGMVGEGVLHECLQHKNVERVLVYRQKAVRCFSTEAERNHT